MAKVELIQLHEAEIVSEMALTMAYCIGATYDNAEKIANSFTPEEIYECVTLIREKLSKGA
jgi:hypothetical protein